MLESWEGFREAILKRFKRKILFHVVLQKIEARKWNFAKESFLDYALEKLALMHLLNLPSEESIHLLINGISSRALRATAASLRAEIIDDFLEDMQA